MMVIKLYGSKKEIEKMIEVILKENQDLEVHFMDEDDGFIECTFYSSLEFDTIKTEKMQKVIKYLRNDTALYNRKKRSESDRRIDMLRERIKYL